MCCTVFTIPAMYPLVPYLYPTLCTDSSLNTLNLSPPTHYSLTHTRPHPCSPALQHSSPHTCTRPNAQARARVELLSGLCGASPTCAQLIASCLNCSRWRRLLQSTSVLFPRNLLNLTTRRVYTSSCVHACVYMRKKEKETSGETKDKGRKEEKTVFEEKS